MTVKTILLLLACLLVIFLLLSGPLFSKNAKDFTVRKQPEIQQIQPKKPARIKLKRIAAGKYSWDLTGDDVDEVMKTDRRLREMLNIK